MHAGISWGTSHLEIEVGESNLIVGQRAPIAADIGDPTQVMHSALEHPLDYPALRFALTPDDQVAIVVDEGIPNLGRLLTPLLEHISQAHVPANAITLVCAPAGTSSQEWLDDLPEAYQDVHVEIHQPNDRKKLAYLATTKQGRRVYLNRTAVDAGVTVVISRRRYDPCLGYAGAEMALFPGLSDAETIQEFRGDLDLQAPGQALWPIQQEGRKITWYLGAPFFVQLIEGNGDALAHILAGPLESSDAGQRLLDARWRIEFDQPADVVIASVTGSPQLHKLDDLARAFFAAARVVKPNGSIVLLSDLSPPIGSGMENFRRHDDPALALASLQQEKPADLATGFMWASAANQARLYLLSGIASDVAEELFTVPMQRANQAQRLLTDTATCILLPDAHKTLAVLR